MLENLSSGQEIAAANTSTELRALQQGWDITIHQTPRNDISTILGPSMDAGSTPNEDWGRWEERDGT